MVYISFDVTTHKCVCGHDFQQTGHQPGMVANPSCGQPNRESGIRLYIGWKIEVLLKSLDGKRASLALDRIMTLEYQPFSTGRITGTRFQLLY